MKTRLTKIFTLGFIFILASCNKPNPVELERSESEDDSYSLEIISTDPNQFDYQNGYDSTGIANPLPEASAEFIISLFKNSDGNNSNMGNRHGIAKAAFYDKQNPIYNDRNRLVGYLTKDMGTVKFNNFTAIKRAHRVRFKNSNSIIDSLAGVEYHLPLRPMMNILDNIDIKLSSNNNLLFESSIAIPIEINARIEKIVEGSTLRGLKLYWNGLGNSKIEIIIGGYYQQNLSPFPLIRIKVADDGSFVLPSNILERIPYNNFESLVFSFIRKIEKRESSNSLSDNYIAAQSIHNIRVNLNN